MSTITVGWVMAAALTLSVAAVAAPAVEQAAVEQAAVERVTAAQVSERLTDPQVLVVDVRTAEEYGAGYVPGAINIPHAAIVDNTALLESYRDRELIVYCQSGRRAGIAIEALRQAGYGRLRHMAGDMPGWHAAGLPVDR